MSHITGCEMSFSDYKALLGPNLYSEKDFCNIVMSQLHSHGCKNTGRAQARES